jgi:DnaK suppressor protein
VAKKTTSTGSKRTTKAAGASVGKASSKSVARTTAAGKKSTTKKSAAKKATTKKSAAKQSTTKKAATKQAASRKAATDKGAAASGKPTKKTTRKSTQAPVNNPTRSAPGRSAAATSVKAAGPDAPLTREQQAIEAVNLGHRLSESQLRKAKSGLTRKQLNGYRELLFEKRAQLLGDVASLQNDVSEKAGNLSSMPLHMADVGTDHYEQEFTLGLMESDRKTLREIDAAIIRISNGTYGVCMMTGLPIGTARLDAKPWARYCIEVVREREKRGQYE